jgi:hypothetical protein
MESIHDKIHREAVETGKAFKRSEIALIETLQSVWSHKTHYQYDSSSLFDYAVHHMGLSEEFTSMYNKVAKKALEIKGFKEQIRDGYISISKASRICSVITEENKEFWFKKARGTKRELEREIAKLSPKSAMKEKVKYRQVGEEIRVELHYSVSEAEYENTKRAQDLLSQKLGRHATLEDLDKAAKEALLSKIDPLRRSCPPKKDRAQKPGRQRVSMTLTREAHHKSDSQCMHVDDDGKRCQERRFLHLHHIKPVKEGGTNHIDNLVVFCSGHHRAHHHQEHGSIR